MILVDFCGNFPWFRLIFGYPDPDPFHWIGSGSRWPKWNGSKRIRNTAFYSLLYFSVSDPLIWIRILGSVSGNDGSGSCSRSDLNSRKYQLIFYFFFYLKYISPKNDLFCYFRFSWNRSGSGWPKWNGPNGSGFETLIYFIKKISMKFLIWWNNYIETDQLKSFYFYFIFLFIDFIHISNIVACTLYMKK